MSNIYLNRDDISRWFADDGDTIHNLNYPLDENSIVIDIGGYTGVWAQQMVKRYNPHIYIIEPLNKYYTSMVHKFSKNHKVKLMNVGVADTNKTGKIYLNGDASSTNVQTGDSVDVTFKTLSTILDEWGLEEVDLIQINIEGDEYTLLESLISTGLITSFKNIQVQFHHGIDDCIERREKIRKELAHNNFEINFDYPFVWESWRRK